MGNALWTGVRLRDVLDRAGLKATARQVQFGGLESPALPTTPDFRKSLDVDRARGDDILIAYAMNGAPLPLLNGFPVRLIVPGWYSTYWVKMLSAITVLDHVDDNFWMKTAYRIPDTPDNSVIPGATGFPTIPINRMRVRSFATNVVDGAKIDPKLQELRGIAFDGGKRDQTRRRSASTAARPGATRRWAPTSANTVSGDGRLRCRSCRTDVHDRRARDRERRCDAARDARLEPVGLPAQCDRDLQGGRRMKRIVVAAALAALLGAGVATAGPIAPPKGPVFDLAPR